MLRRNFLRLGAITAITASIIPTQLSAIDFRNTKPGSWSATNVDDAIKALYGDVTLIKGDITLTAPSVASNAKTVPLNVRSSIQAKSVALFQDANPEATIAVFTMNEGAILDYDIKLRMAKSGVITAVVEGLDGKFYVSTKALQVSPGGCDGS